jgi:hypothetical protein
MGAESLRMGAASGLAKPSRSDAAGPSGLGACEVWPGVRRACLPRQSPPQALPCFVAEGDEMLLLTN